MGKVDLHNGAGFSFKKAESVASPGKANYAAIVAKVEALKVSTVQLRHGTASPFDANIIDLRGADHIWTQDNSDPRLEFEGMFVPATSSPTMGQTAPQRDADFPARSDAMALAYHFGTALAEAAQQTVKDIKVIDAYSDTMRDAVANIYGISANGAMLSSVTSERLADEHGTQSIVWSMRGMEINAASLGNLFSFDSASVTKAAYGGEFKGFSISHGTLGKIMDVGADGAITLYGADGASYSAADYSANIVDGGIPQLRNDMIRLADRQSSTP